MGRADYVWASCCFVAAQLARSRRRRRRAGRVVRRHLHLLPGGTAHLSYNSRVRDECLNINMFWSLAQARVVISDWKADYNHGRRHSALGYQAPAVYAAARTDP